MNRATLNPLVAAMAANLSPRDVSRGDTALVLMRAGYRAADIAAHIDEVEAAVRPDPRVPRRVAPVAGLALLATSGPALAAPLGALETAGVFLAGAAGGLALWGIGVLAFRGARALAATLKGCGPHPHDRGIVCGFCGSIQSARQNGRNECVTGECYTWKS